MTRGPLQLFRRRTLRRLAGFVVGFLLAGHALAAAGLCVVTSPDTAPLAAEASGACAEHGGSSPAGGPAVKHHCPAEEPTAQARSVDLPAPQPAAVVASLAFQLAGPAAERRVQVLHGHSAPPPPLYARLQRLRL